MIFLKFQKVFYGFYWPLPSNHRISSYYGYRVSPTAGASNFHKGIDIPASEGTYFLALFDSVISFVGFNGSSGYCIICSTDLYKIIYCHTSPNYIVSVGDKVIAGQIIGQVGPKYVYDVVGNPYHDSTGKPTNGATTGCHLHLSIKENNEYKNPLDFLQND